MSNLANKLTVGIGTDFLSSFAKLPAKQQKKVGAFVENFRTNPCAPGINYEKISGARDPNLRSVRIDEAYRGIVLKPARGNVYLLLWVDHHDEAYDWARRRQVIVNAHTGSVQVLTCETAEKPPEPRAPNIPTDALLAGCSDQQLLSLGVPEALLTEARSLRSDEELEEKECLFPEEATEALYMLAMGYAVDDVLAEKRADKEPESPIDTDDFAKALENDDSKRRFHVVSDNLELTQLLDAPLEKWRVFLHPSQRRLITMHANGPVRVLGGAGTGKTVVAMHRAKYLAENVFNGSGDRILFTTFTRNLAEDIEANLSKICPLAVKRRIQVVNLDAWAAGYLKKHGFPYTPLTSEAKSADFWERACELAANDLGLSLAFYRQEWEDVVQAGGIMTEEDYFRASRIGRGQRLSRRQRKDVWPVFEEYRALLRKDGFKEFTDVLRDARVLLEKHRDAGFKSVVVDEAQDMSQEAFRLIRELAPPPQANDLFVVGDAHQRIYAHKVVLGHCGVDIRGRGRRLRLNYRTTDEIRKWAVALLEGCSVDDLDGGMDSLKGYRSLFHGASPLVKIFDSVDEEKAAILEHLAELKKAGIAEQSVCLVARTDALLKDYSSALIHAGLRIHRIRQDASDATDKPGIRVASMHRVKGLEFDAMVVAGVNHAALPLANVLAHLDTDHAKREFELKERSLLHVCATRARKHVLITAPKPPSTILPK